MFVNYLRSAIRNLVRHKGYACFNILGLAIGMTCFVLISLFVRYELSYDTFHEKAKQIYRVVEESPGFVYLGTNHFAVTPAPLAPALVAELPEIVQSTRIKAMNNLISNGKLKMYEDGLWADEHFFDVFTFPLLQGDPKTALAEPNTIVLSESMARKYFEEDDPMGKTLLLRNETLLQVTGIIADPPENSHFTFNYLVSLSIYDLFIRDANNWGSLSYYTYFVLADGHSIDEVEAKLPAFTKTHTADTYDDPTRMPRYYLQPLTDIHLYSHLNFEIKRNGDITYVYMLSTIAVVILLIACINYMNLATARSATRVREVGLRKVVGASRSQLIVQFLGESIVLSFIAVALAGLLVPLFLSTFNALVEREIPVDLTRHWLFGFGLTGVGLLVGIVSGSYPALVLSRAHPVRVIRNIARRGTRRAMLRNVLVVSQFAATIVLLVGTVVISQQLNYIRTADTGVNRSYVVVIPMKDPEVSKQYDTIRQTVITNPNILMVSSSTWVPTQVESRNTIRDWEGNDGTQKLDVFNTGVNYNYIEMFDLKLVEGRSFSREFATDQNAVLLNETAARQLGWDPAVGKRFEKSYTVIGVVKDFHFNSFHHRIEPLQFYLRPEWSANLLIKIQPQHIPETIAFLESTIQTFSPDYPFEYEFLDDAFNRMYQTETTLGQMFRYCTVITLVLACLGLLSLMGFMTEQRTREIGIRKVLGASIPNILWLLSREFTVLVGIAFVIAAPIAYYAMYQWLQDFAYRIELGAGMFALAGFLAFLIAWVTVSYQSIKAATANPVDSLRYE